MNSDPDFQTFLSLSEILTGYSVAELEGTTMAEDYFGMLMKEHDQVGVRNFLEKARSLLSLGKGAPAAIEQEFIAFPATVTTPNPDFDQLKYDGLAQRIILLWYSSVWTTMNESDVKSQPDRTSIVSTRAYEQGLIWLTAETHPAGARQPGFGSWSEPPLT